MMRKWSNPWPWINNLALAFGWHLVYLSVLYFIINKKVIIYANLPDIPHLDKEEGYCYLRFTGSTDFLSAKVLEKDYTSHICQIMNADLTMHNTIVAIYAYGVICYTLHLWSSEMGDNGNLAKLDTKHETC
eukprot:7456229-Ditylum_brightwellii.AAC.1